MRKRRDIYKDQSKNLANGPSKLCIAMGITKKHNGIDLCNSSLFIEKGMHVDKDQICQAKRINIEYAAKWKHLPWRFFIKDNDFVSVKTFKN